MDLPQLRRPVVVAPDGADATRRSVAGGRNSVRSRTWSTPPWLHGLQRSSRNAASPAPRTTPCRSTAISAYCEQLG